MLDFAGHSKGHVKPQFEPCFSRLSWHLTVLTVPYPGTPCSNRRHGDGLRPGGGSAAALPAAGRPAGGLRGRVGGLGGVHDGLLCPQNPDLAICGRGIHWCVPWYFESRILGSSWLQVGLVGYRMQQKIVVGRVC